MKLCILYLASPSAAVVHPVKDCRRRYDALKYSMTTMRKLFPTTPFYVFHEDYSAEDMAGLPRDSNFVQIDFSGFDNVFVPVHSSKGYMMMCRFFSGIVQNHPVLQEYTHYIRMDDDSYMDQPYLTEEKAKLYEPYDYVYRSVFYEAKSQQSLFDFTMHYLRKNGMYGGNEIMLKHQLTRERILINNQYSGKAPYNNFHCSSLALWRHPVVQRYIGEIESNYGILRNGWLDANIHAMIVWVLIPGLRLNLTCVTDTTFGYRHNKHVSAIHRLDIAYVDTFDFIPQESKPITYIDLQLPGKFYFVTFANTRYMTMDRIQKQAEEMKVFDKIICLTEHDIPDYIETHKQYISNNIPGYGRWIWKSKVVLDTLLTMSDGDFLVYGDAGMYLNPHGLPRLAEYMKLLQSPDTGCIAFATNGYYSHSFANPDAVSDYFPEFYENIYRYCYAGIFILKKTPETMNMITDWFTLCQNYDYLSGNSTRVHPEFVGGDGDNGLFNLCLAKHGSIVKRVHPDETNVYHPDNVTQNISAQDWSSLDSFPFQCRRIRPPR